VDLYPHRPKDAQEEQVDEAKHAKPEHGEELF
jgi:hypothetical protein